MSELIIEPGEKTPGIDLSYGIMLFYGRSIITDPKVFFEPVINWLKKYLKNPADITVATIKLEYIDAKSSQALFQILQMLNELRAKGLVFMVNWYYSYGDFDMLELGEVIQGRLEMEFEFIEFTAETFD